MGDKEYREVAALSDVPRGKTLCVEVNGQEILLCHTSEGIFAVDNLCTHAQERLCDGKLKGHRLFCPLHSGSFDVRDGAVLSRPASIPLVTYSVKLEAEAITILL